MLSEAYTQLTGLGESWDQPVNRLYDQKWVRPTEGPFYHGTRQELKPGDVINAQRADDPVFDKSPYRYPLGDEQQWGKVDPSSDKVGYAFATRNIDTARTYAQSTTPRTGIPDSGGSVGYVYEVEPLEFDYSYDPEDSMLPADRGDRGGKEAFRSPSGWRVVRLVEELPSLKEQYPEDYA